MNTRKKFGKARWIDIRLSKSYRRSVAGARMVVASGVVCSLVGAMSRIHQIRASSFRSGPVSKIGAQLAIAETVVGAMSSAASLAKEQSGRIADIKKRHGVVA